MQKLLNNRIAIFFFIFFTISKVYSQNREYVTFCKITTDAATEHYGLFNYCVGFDFTAPLGILINMTYSSHKFFFSPNFQEFSIASIDNKLEYSITQKKNGKPQKTKLELTDSLLSIYLLIPVSRHYYQDSINLNNAGGVYIFDVDKIEYRISNQVPLITLNNNRIDTTYFSIGNIRQISFIRQNFSDTKELYSSIKEGVLVNSRLRSISYIWDNQKTDKKSKDALSSFNKNISVSLTRFIDNQ